MGHYEHSDCECDLKMPTVEDSDNLVLEIAAIFLNPLAFKNLLYLYLPKNCQLTERTIQWIQKLRPHFKGEYLNIQDDARD